MNLFTSFKEKVIETFSAEQVAATHDIDNLIALGVLLWVVADADKKFLPEEKDKIGEVLREYGEISEEDMSVVLRAIKEASVTRIDLYSFTESVGGNLKYEAKIEIIENLFHVACSDKDLAHEEHEAIRKISGLLRVDHKDFINAKLKVKKEFGIES